jgi:hypothetical protein
MDGGSVLKPHVSVLLVLVSDFIRNDMQMLYKCFVAPEDSILCHRFDIIDVVIIVLSKKCEKS